RSRPDCPRHSAAGSCLRRGMAESRIAWFCLCRCFDRTGRPRPTHRPAQSRATQRPLIRRALCSISCDALGRQRNAQCAAFANHYRGRQARTGQCASVAGIAGKRIIGAARGSSHRGNFVEPACALKIRITRKKRGAAKNVISTMGRRRTEWISLAAIIAMLSAWATITFAEHTRRWKQSTYDEFLKGTTHGVAVRSDGRLELAPKFAQLADADASYLWAVKLDSKGTP